MAMITAHARMYDAIKQEDAVDADRDGTAASVGIVYAVSEIDPRTSDAEDATAAAHARYLFNDMFLDGVAKGEVDPDWNGHKTSRPDLAGRLDFLGVNYYFRMQVHGRRAAIPGTSLISPYLDFDPFDVESDGSYPQGIAPVLADMAKYGVPLVVSETGTDQSTGKGSWWFVNALSWTLVAQRQGVDVRGFYGWTLTDNYEWNHGMQSKFGFYAVDPADPTKARMPRASAADYGRMGAERGVPTDLALTYGAPL
jgi:beta-glucosidase